MSRGNENSPVYITHPHSLNYCYDVHPLFALERYFTDYSHAYYSVLYERVPNDDCSPTDDTSTFKDVTYGHIQMQVLQLKLLFFRGLDEKFALLPFEIGKHVHELVCVVMCELQHESKKETYV
ncbi:hypothetical protein POVWA2_058290 [Plasmodium ovale wallikeri]|uniref:Uncharacterized protein n=1 Tax=Plasmodium ovale wallikeri TaxID=864142 RepID=A0A1A9A0B1_PLAOA|nr:hypothetical protein POVWA1_058980 [Plasmodium ovale wallikeri]SBT49529.1 hypothetical protein POVWA2_058290 [Plasmodium ovale wallikeri]